MSIIEPRTWEQAILEQRNLYTNMTDTEFIAYFAGKHKAVTEHQVSLVLKHYEGGDKHVSANLQG